MANIVFNIAKGRVDVSVVAVTQAGRTFAEPAIFRVEN